MIKMLYMNWFDDYYDNSNGNNKVRRKMLSNSSKFYKNSLSKECNLLLIIAHPDDEAMFFGPTLLSLSSSCNVSILCLSNGNYKGAHYSHTNLYTHY